MHPHRRQRFEEVEEAYGEPFWDVVRRFARRGLSQEHIAELVGYSRRGLANRIRQDQVSIPWQCHTKKQRALRKATRRRGWSTWLTIRGRTRPLTFWARWTGLPPNTIRQRYQRGLRGDDLIAPPMSRHRRGRIGMAVRLGRIPWHDS